jgi:hypothetical protein
MRLEYSSAQQMGKSGESMQLSGSSTDVAYGRARRRNKEIELDCGNQNGKQTAPNFLKCLLIKHLSEVVGDSVWQVCLSDPRHFEAHHVGQKREL